MFAYVGTYQGFNDVYSFTQVARRDYIRIVGIDKEYGLNKGYTKVKFNMYIPLAEGEVLGTNNMVMNLNNGTGLFSAWSPSEVSGKRLTIINTLTGEPLSAVVGNTWMTLIADLSDLGSASNLTPRIHFEIGGNAGMVVYMQGAAIYTPEQAEYAVEYYLEGEGGTFTKDDTYGYTAQGEAELGAKAQIKEIEGFTFDAENVNNVPYGTVLADGSLVLKMYYAKSVVRNYDVEYYLQDNDGTYVKSTTLSETKQGNVGETVSAEIKDVNGYIYSMRNPLQVLSAQVIDEDTPALKVYYDIAIPVSGAGVSAVFAGETYKTVIKNIGTTGAVTNGLYDVYEHTATETGSFRLMIFGTSAEELAAAEIKKVSFKFYITSDFTVERLYEYISYTTGSHELRLNSGNISGKDFIRLFDDTGTRVYDIAVGYEGWITIEISLENISAYAISDSATSVTNSGVYVAFYTTTGSWATNQNKPLYISQVEFSTDAMSDSIV